MKQQINPTLKTEKPEYFSLRPEVEKTYGYPHAVKIGNDIKISGAVSMDDEGNPNCCWRFVTTDEKLLLRSGQSVETLGLHLRRCYC